MLDTRLSISSNDLTFETITLLIGFIKKSGEGGTWICSFGLPRVVYSALLDIGM